MKQVDQKHTSEIADNSSAKERQNHHRESISNARDNK
jgi:hypothetical protein